MWVEGMILVIQALVCVAFRWVFVCSADGCNRQAGQEVGYTCGWVVCRDIAIVPGVGGTAHSVPVQVQVLEFHS
jgi:hypothetical protein